MRSDANPVYVLSSSRIPFVKSQTAYAEVSRQDLMVASLNSLVQKAGLKGKLVGDTALGAVINSAGDWNLARECLLSTEVHPESPAYNIQRACGTGLEAVWQIALKAHTGSIDFGIAGGVDTNSDLPIEVSDKYKHFLLRLSRARSVGQRLKIFATFSPFALKPKIPTVTEPRTLLSMGQHTERMVKEWQIPREEQDQIAYLSHLHGAKAYDEGFYEDLVTPFNGLKRDGILRADTSVEKLAKLKPAFDPQNGSLTAGNSSPLTDGAACVLVGNQKGADQLGLKPLAKIVDVQAAAVDFVHGAGLLMAPTKAIARLLTRNQLTFKDFDYFEVHEAFAGQVLCNLKALESEKYCKEVLGLNAAVGPMDRSKLNVVGSSIALGHPFAATGARITGTLSKLLSKGGNKRGLISICTAGGMGVAAVLESA
jgi:acetyl-CoA C-acetyltransferase